MGDHLIEIKEDFLKQIEKVKEEIINLENELNKKKEHFLKLQGGLETLAILEQKVNLNNTEN
jgi:hypothetical protein